MQQELRKEQWSCDLCHYAGNLGGVCTDCCGHTNFSESRESVLNRANTEISRLRGALEDIASAGTVLGSRLTFSSDECLRRYEIDGGCDSCTNPGRDTGQSCYRAEALLALKAGEE